MAKKSTFSYIIPVGNILVTLAVIAEMIFFPSLNNALGCGMTIICWVLFAKFGLSLPLIRQHIFSWLIFLSMSLYRILPLFATLAERKPISYGFMMAFDTFVGETFLYILSLLAFLFAVRRRKYNTRFHVFLNKLDYYDEIPNISIWIIGAIGLLSQLYVLLVHVEIGDVVGKMLSALTYFQYAPILLFFPSLYKRHSDRIFQGGIIKWAYFVFLVVLLVASNSRQALLEPFGTFALLFLLTYIKDRKKASQIFSKNIIILGIAVILLMPIISDISLAMLSVRNIRTSISAQTLLKETFSIYFNDMKMDRLRKQKSMLQKNKEVGNYDEDWTEDYVDNFALNRYCNIRVTDATLYYKQTVGNSNSKMQANFKRMLWSLLPTPILHKLKVNIDKKQRYSPGDYLYSLSTNTPIIGSMRVTSHLSDGLATFGYLYFPIQFVLFWLSFLAVDCFSVKTISGIRYSAFGLISIFSFLAMFRNAIGCFGEVSYLLRAFPQFLILSWICMALSRFLSGDNVSHK